MFLYSCATDSLLTGTPVLQDVTKQCYLALFPGIPELDVPSIEPLTLPEVLVAQGAGIRAVGKNIEISGPGNFIIKKLK
jgi:hypothetical protein